MSYGPFNKEGVPDMSIENEPSPEVQITPEESEIDSHKYNPFISHIEEDGELTILDEDSLPGSIPPKPSRSDKPIKH